MKTTAYAFIALILNIANELVAKSAPDGYTLLVNTAALAKSRSGKLNYSSAGSGTTQHLSGELFKLRTQTNIVHIPYKGSAPS